MFLFGTGALPILGQPLPYIMDMVYNNPKYYLAVTNQIAPHQNLIFSINALEKYDKLWEEWRQLAKEPSCATIYTDMAFRNKVEGSIGELAEEIREMIKE